MVKKFLIFPNQLFKDVKILKDYKVYLIEEPLFFYSPSRPLKFNKLKLVLHRASMKYYFDYLRSKGIDVIYTDDVPINKSDTFFCYDVVDHLLYKKLKKYNPTYLDSPNFICNLNEVKGMKPHHATFYAYMKKKFSILQNEKSHDNENRLPLPINAKVPAFKTKRCKYVKEAQEWVETNFPNNYGNTTNVQHMVFTHNDASLLLDDFIKHRLKHFGDYQDAIAPEHTFLYHSNISHALNIGLLSPMECINAALNSGEKMNNVEGFVRQILGWREYTRFLYIFYYNKMVKPNFMQANNKLTKEWYTGDLGIKPVDDAIKQAFEYGYLHHIQRLMVVGNAMNLMKIHPNQMYKWFMEFAIDSYDWVMISNVYSMLAHADGGLTTTKPYIASDAYIIKMSNGRYGKEPKIKTLFYNYIATAPKVNKVNYIESNPRTKYLYNLWKNKTDEEKKKILRDSKEIIGQLNSTK